MNRRVAYAVGGLLVLVLLGGCLGSGGVSESDLAEDASYDWDTNATTTYDVTSSSYSAIFQLTNRSELTVYDRNFIGTESPIQMRGLQFRYPNGTVVNSTHEDLTVDVEDRRAHVSVPAENGSLAFNADRSGKSFSTRVFVEGSYEVTLPPSARVGIPLLSSARPGGYETRVVDDRMTLRWEDVTASSFQVRWYLERDIYLFGGLVAVAGALGIGGALYYWRQIRNARKRREEVGLDVEMDEAEDPRDDGPPPGMR